MKPLVLLRGASVFVLLSGAVATTRAGSFSAELLDSRDGQTHTGAFYLQDKSYRVELVDRGDPVIVIFDGASQITRIIEPAKKEYLQGGADSPIGRMASPFGFYAFAVRTAEVTTEGTEEVAGVSCARQIVSRNGQVYCTAWYSSEYGIPLKIEIPLFGQTAELRGIKPGPQDAALFTVPADYTEAPDPTLPPIPDWASRIADSPLLTPPFDQTVNEGQIIRLQLQGGRSVRMHYTNARGETSAFTAVGFKGGRPTSGLSGNTMNLEADQEVSGEVSRQPGEVDDYVIRVGLGSVRIRATVEPEANESAP